MLGCGAANQSAMKPPSATQLATFLRSANIKLPVSARPIGWKQESGLDRVLWLLVKMPASDLSEFLRNSPFRDTPLASSDAYQISAFNDFLPKAPTRYRAAQQSLPNTRALNIFVDESDINNVTVSLMWHET